MSPNLSKRTPKTNGFFCDKIQSSINIPENISSGSEHDGEVDDDGGGTDDCLSLSKLVYNFYMDEADDTRPGGDVSDSELELCVDDSIEDLRRSTTVLDKADSYRNLLYGDVIKGIEVFSCLNSNKHMLRRNLMTYLRNLGYNAAICKSKWESFDGLTAGSYEFIDVLRSDSGGRTTRYFIDLDFATEFEIARPTAQYERLLRSTSKVFVGTIEELKRNLKVLSDAANRSLKSKELHLPPWRKHHYIQNKWLSPYKRTTNALPATSPLLMLPPAKHQLAVKCRTVGFETKGVNDHFVLPAATRTR